jgi:drug/metabolite transporter (DMT)-like permease
LSLEITLLILLAAALHASWNALVKSSRDPLVELTALNLAGGVVSLPFLALFGFPGPAAAPYLAGNVLCHTAYYTLLLNSYSEGGLSLVYPIARGIAPLLVSLAATAILGERLEGRAFVGILLIAVSIASLAFAGGVRHFRPRAVVLSLATGASIAAYTFVDGSGARASSNPISYIASLFVLDAFVLLPAVCVRRPGTALDRLRAHWRTGALSGVLSVVAYGIAVWAMTRAPIPLVAALRETSVVAAAILGAFLLGEPFGTHRVIASVGVALGVAVLRISS